MKTKILGSAFMLILAGAGLAGAASKHAKLPSTNADLVKEVRHEIAMYPYYTLWDDIKFNAADGRVVLMGAVNQPFKKRDIEKIVNGLPGVTSVEDDIRVLPLSNFDDRIRLQVARAIFREPSLSRYAIEPIPSIHIIVDNGHVTLEGVVANQADKNIAGIRASSAGLSFGPIVNNLQVEGQTATKS